MAEYISRETMIKLLQSMAENAEANGFSYDREVIEAVKVTLAGIPTADVAPVVYGKVTDMLGSLKVSEIQCPDCRRTIYVPIQLRFCERCGEKLEVCDNG